MRLAHRVHKKSAAEITRFKREPLLFQQLSSCKMICPNWAGNSFTWAGFNEKLITIQAPSQWCRWTIYRSCHTPALSLKRFAGFEPLFQWAFNTKQLRTSNLWDTIFQKTQQ